MSISPKNSDAAEIDGECCAEYSLKDISHTFTNALRPYIRLICTEIPLKPLEKVRTRR